MPDILPVAWCTNVHDAHSVQALCESITSVADALRAPAAVGLWLSPDMLREDSLLPLRSTLDQLDLPCIGLNGFPAMAFRDEVVKTRVYRPNWNDPARLEYTEACAKALTCLLGEAGEGGITTLPLGWPAHGIDTAHAAHMVREACCAIDRIGRAAGCTMHLAIEPEPGCVLDTVEAAATFVDDNALGDLADAGLLRICLDTCHLAVMHESPSSALAAMDWVGLRTGRVQISSAVQADLPDDEARAALEALVEPRWMHQTTVLAGDVRSDFDDLQDALAADVSGHWRTHLHVPVHLSNLAPLGTTQHAIAELMETLATRSDRPALEVETYAWNIVPDAHRLASLPQDIALELDWTRSLARQVQW
jgi:sugar phosphate isomerase/epimerase